MILMVLLLAAGIVTLAAVESGRRTSPAPAASPSATESGGPTVEVTPSAATGQGSSPG